MPTCRATALAVKSRKAQVALDRASDGHEVDRGPRPDTSNPPRLISRRELEDGFAALPVESPRELMRDARGDVDIEYGAAERGVSETAPNVVGIVRADDLPHRSVGEPHPSRTTHVLRAGSRPITAHELVVDRAQRRSVLLCVQPVSEDGHDRAFVRSRGKLDCERVHRRSADYPTSLAADQHVCLPERSGKAVGVPDRDQPDARGALGDVATAVTGGVAPHGGSWLRERCSATLGQPGGRRHRPRR